MNNTIDLLRGVWQLIWKQLVQTVLIIVTYAALPHKTLVSLILTILVYTYLYKLLFSEAPSPKRWLVVYPLLTTLVTSVFYLLYFWAGAFGIFGAVVLLVGIAGLRIYQSWALFDAVTSWGAERVRGKHTDAFDINKVVEREQRRDTKTIGSSDDARQEGSGDEQPGLNVQGVPVLPEAPVQEVSGSGAAGRVEGQADAAGVVVSDVPRSVRKRTKKVKL